MYRPTATQFVIGGVIVAVIALVIFAPRLARQLFNTAQGYPPATTPQECVDGFRKAINARQYALAAEVYCTGNYAEQMKKVAEGANKLGKSIDSVAHQMSVRDYDSEKMKFILMWMEPFPKEFDVPNIKEASDGKTAYATFREVPPKRTWNDPSWQNFRLDASFYRVLCNGTFPVNTQATLHLVEEGKKSFWKLEFPIDNALPVWQPEGGGKVIPNLPDTMNIRQRADRFVARWRTYTKIMESLEQRLRQEPNTKAYYEDTFKQEIESASKDD